MLFLFTIVHFISLLIVPSIYTEYLYKPPFVCNGKQTKIPDHRIHCKQIHSK